MTLPSRKLLVANTACLLLLVWLYGGDLVDAIRARGAEVSAFTAPPSAVRPTGVLVFTALGLGAAVWGLLQRRGEDYKGYRLLPIVLVSALFLDLVFAERRSPLRSVDLATVALQALQRQAQEQATADAVPADPAVLSPLLEKLGPPPFLVRGQPLTQYALQVRQDCDGPVRSAPGLHAGTLIYCVAPGRKGAWITLVGLPAERRFGPPEVLSVNGEVRFALVQPVPPEEALPPPPQEQATPFLDRRPGDIPPPTPATEGKDARPAP